nr:MAG TPA: hypothetical protein [Caudoviricetes sp.]
MKWNASARGKNCFFALSELLFLFTTTTTSIAIAISF